MTQLSVVMIVKNEATQLERCLNSVAWADDCLVVDTGSTDSTPALAAQLGARVLTHPWSGFGEAKRFAVDSAQHRWVFVLDADEVVTPELRHAIETLLQTEPACSGYRIRRISNYLGQWIRHGGWERDYSLRLFDRERGNFNLRPVHEYVELQGSVGRIDAPLQHYPYARLGIHIQKIDQYTELAARQAVDKGKHSSLAAACLHGLGKFLTMYLLRRGFLDGRAGLALALNSAFYVYLKYLKIWEYSRG